MYSRILHINPQSKSSIFLFGPRGTGKTSWVKQHFPNALYFDLLDSDVYAELLARPVRYIRPMGSLDLPKETQGPALETLFLQESKASNDYYNLGYEFFYWHTRSHLEVDFIAYGKGGLYAFEIKRKGKLTGNDFKGLVNFGLDFPMAKLYMLYGGRKSTYKNISVLPCQFALTNLREILSSNLQ